MAEEQNKKPKIDLRARLGKKTAGGAGASIPPPMAGVGGSIPAPPFGSQAPPPAAGSIPPAPRPSSPIPSPAAFGNPSVSQPAPAPRIAAEPQAIRIEMGEEVVMAQKKGRKKVMILAAVAALVGGIIGVQFGGGMERRSRQNIAVDGAKTLSKEIDEANAQISKMADVLAEAKRGLSDGEYPEKAVNDLAETGISFNGTYLYGKGVGLMSPMLNKQLVDFAGKAVAANDQKEKLQLVLSSAKEPISALLAQADKPKFNWAVYVVAGPHGPMAGMQPLPEPFLVTSKEKVKDKDGQMVAYSWPKEVEVPGADGKKEKLQFYEKGSPVSRDPLLIPVEPSTQASVCPNDVQIRLRQEIVKLEELLRGDKSDPTNEQLGLIDLGNVIIDELKGIGMGG